MEYINLDLELSNYQKVSSNQETFCVHVVRSSCGPMTSDTAVPVTLNSEQRKRISHLKARGLSKEEMIEGGEEVGKMLFPPNTQVWRMYDKCLNDLKDGQRLRIRLTFGNYALSDLPWEFAYILPPNTPDDQKDLRGFLVLNKQVSLVRFPALEGKEVSLNPVGEGKLRMVVIMANPKNDPVYQDLEIGREFEKMKEVLEKVPKITPEPHPDATRETIQDALMKPAHIFHFAGHGGFEADLGAGFKSTSGHGYIILLDEEGKGDKFYADKLAGLLRASQVRLAVFTACETGGTDQINAWTGVVPALIREGIPAVVGMQFKIEDQNAIAFSRQFYLALAEGLSIDAAVTEGRQAIFMGKEDERDWGVPVLYLRDNDGILFPTSRVLPKRSRPREKEPLEVSRYLPLRLQHFEQFLGYSLEPAELKIGGFEPVSKLRFKLLHQKPLEKPRILTVSGTLFPCGLLNSGWWERAGGYKPTRIRWRDPVQAWLFNGFDLWAPSWDFSWNLDSCEVASKKPCFVAQLGSGDEADSLPVVLQYEKAKRLRDDFIDRGGCLEVELTGLLGRREHFTAKLGESGKELEEKLRIFGGLLDYCLWLSDEEKTHSIKVLRDETEMYSGYLWKCLAPKEWLKDEKRLKLDEVYFVWEHTNFASKEAIKYNLDSLEHKEQYIRSMHGDLVLIQKSSSLVPGKPELLSQDIYDLLLRGQCDVVK